MRDVVWNAHNRGDLFCLAPDCWSPPAQGSTYCSDTCRRRIARRRDRYRSALRDTRRACIECGTRHGNDGNAWLPRR